MQATTKRYEESRESGGEVKGVVLILICYFYGILLFLFFGTVTKLGQFVFNKSKLWFRWSFHHKCDLSYSKLIFNIWVSDISESMGVLILTVKMSVCACGGTFLCILKSQINFSVVL